MNKTIPILVLTAVSAVGTHASVTIGFDEFPLPPESFYNGADGAGGFTSHGVHFNNVYDANWGAWSGFALSNITDNQTRGWTNQYAAATGGGHSGSGNYLVAYAFGDHAAITLSDGYQFVSAKVTNTAYAFFSMLEGDDFAKKFGGETGADPDWFRLDVTGLDGGGNTTGSFSFYLADYREGREFILTTWELLDFSPLGVARKAVFTLSSSDEGVWGMNTPAFFALDSLSIIPEPKAYAMGVGLILAVFLGAVRRRSL